MKTNTKMAWNSGYSNKRIIWSTFRAFCMEMGIKNQLFYIACISLCFCSFLMSWILQQRSNQLQSTLNWKYTLFFWFNFRFFFGKIRLEWLVFFQNFFSLFTNQANFFSWLALVIGIFKISSVYLNKIYKIQTEIHQKKLVFFFLLFQLKIKNKNKLRQWKNILK